MSICYADTKQAKYERVPRHLKLPVTEAYEVAAWE